MESGEPEGTVLLDIIRYKQHLPEPSWTFKGTAGHARCSLANSSGELEYRSMTSCLLALANVQGKHIVAVEGLNMEKLVPVRDDGGRKRHAMRLLHTGLGGLVRAGVVYRERK